MRLFSTGRAQALGAAVFDRRLHLSDDEEDEVSDATEQSGERIDVRDCPTCGARGNLPVAQPSNPDGTTMDPVMVCPRCDVEFRSTGVTRLGASQSG